MSTLDAGTPQQVYAWNDNRCRGGQLPSARKTSDDAARASNAVDGRQQAPDSLGFGAAQLGEDRVRPLPGPRGRRLATGPLAYGTAQQHERTGLAQPVAGLVVDRDRLLGSPAGLVELAPGEVRLGELAERTVSAGQLHQGHHFWKRQPALAGQLQRPPVLVHRLGRLAELALDRGDRRQRLRLEPAVARLVCQGQGGGGRLVSLRGTAQVVVQLGEGAQGLRLHAAVADLAQHGHRPVEVLARLVEAAQRVADLTEHAPVHAFAGAQPGLLIDLDAFGEVLRGAFQPAQVPAHVGQVAQARRLADEPARLPVDLQRPQVVLRALL